MPQKQTKALRRYPLKARHILIAGILTLSLLASIPGVAAQTAFSETFETYGVLANPSSTSYTYTESVSGSGYAYVVAGNISGSGNRTWKTESSTTSSVITTNFYFGGGDICSNGGLTFWNDANVATANTIDSIASVRLASYNQTEYVELLNTQTDLAAATFATLGNARANGVTATATFATGSSAFTNAAKQWRMECSGSQVIFTDITDATQLQVTKAFNGPLTNITVTVVSGGGGAALTTLLLDEFSASISETPSTFWCSLPSGTDFDYDFVEQVTRVTSDLDIEIDPYYKFAGDSTDYNFLGKSFGGTAGSPGPGSTHMRAYTRIEAASEGADSNFRSAFSFIQSNGTTTVPVLDKGTGTSAGDTSGAFRSHIEARWWEQGNDWDIAIFVVNVTGGYTERTRLGQTFFGDNPNTPTSYVFDLDTVSRIVEVRHYGTNGLDGEVLISETLPSIFTSNQIFSHWYVGYHTAIPLDSDPTLALDENLATDYSTCVEDVTGITSPNGAQGRTPESANLPPETPPAAGNTVFGVQTDPPTGFTQSTFNFLIGIIFMAAMAGGFYFINQKPLMAGIGGGMGFMGAFAFGLFPLWSVLLVALGAAAIVVLRFRSAGA